MIPTMSRRVIAPQRRPSRVIISSVTPGFSEEPFAIKRTPGEPVEVTSQIFADGHDELAVILLWRHSEDREWFESRMQPCGNDCWKAAFTVEKIGFYEYMVFAWIHRFDTLRTELRKKADAGLDVLIELREIAALVRETAAHAPADEAAQLKTHADRLESNLPQETRIQQSQDDSLRTLMDRHADCSRGQRSDNIHRVRVDRERARFSTWYELFPRSCAPVPNHHGTFRDVINHLPHIASMGFNVLYFPPIHPIGTSFRKGKNNALTAEPDDVGSPWGIGADAGGHIAIHPSLGDLDDFHALVSAARDLGIEIALDIAIQCSPDHPYVQEYPEWFAHRIDGTIKYAENPPKKYQDIYPFDFDCQSWSALWEELINIFLYWIDQGVTIFRVDNPHTKPFRFWDYAIATIQAKHPETIFLAEAFTRPWPMKRLAKGGFTQSYSYFTWRTTKAELESYFTELYQTDVVDYLRPNLFANTPDILHESLQNGGRPAFMARYILAATLGANCGIYGPVFERCVNAALHPGSEEYLNSEKYEIHYWHDQPAEDITWLISRVNHARNNHPALQYDRRLQFHTTDNPEILCYSKTSPNGDDFILTTVNLDPRNTQCAWVLVHPHLFGRGHDEPYEVHDLITNARYTWKGDYNFVKLDPWDCPAHIFHIAPKS